MRHKVGGTLTSISHVIFILNSVTGAGVASAGLVLKGVGALGDAGKALMTRGEFNPREIWRTIDGIRSNAGAVWNAYTAVRRVAGNPLERGRKPFFSRDS